MFASIVPITVIAVATLVLDRALAMSLTEKIRPAFKLVVLISPLPGEKSIDECSFNYGFIFDNQAASPMGLIVLPVALIEA